MNEKKTKKVLLLVVIYLIFLVFASVTILPFLWMLSTAFKFEQNVFHFPIQWIPAAIRWENFSDVFTQIPFTTYYWNSIKLSSVITFFTLVTSALAAYAFAKLRFRGRDKLFLLYLATLMVPWQVIMIPQFMVITKIGLVNSHWSLILTQSFTPFGVFLLRQYFLSIPKEYSEAAKIDGCNDLKICFKIITPMAKPGFVTLLIFQFMGIWNDYLALLIFLNDDKLRTLQLGLRYFQAEHSTSYALLMAGTLLTLIPVVAVYIFAQKQIMNGLANAGGIKG
ncbi:carbohydrate ABC transporter permease [Anaerocolumna jejuensis]|nr:carbohydrate ABC transporter permease [Anaerocolumna jejuensis]